MNDNDIVKALECCRMPVGSGSCNNCPLNHIRQKRCIDSKSCTTILFDFTLDFINRQKAEIERLEKQLNGKCDRCIARDRAEAIKEFAWRLKDFCTETTTDNINCPSVMVLSFADEIIDDLVKEMIGEQK